MFNTPYDLYHFIHRLKREADDLTSRPGLAGATLFENYQKILELFLSFETRHSALLKSPSLFEGINLGRTAKDQIDTAWHVFFENKTVTKARFFRKDITYEFKTIAHPFDLFAATRLYLLLEGTMGFGTPLEKNNLLKDIPDLLLNRLVKSVHHKHDRIEKALTEHAFCKSRAEVREYLATIQQLKTAFSKGEAAPAGHGSIFFDIIEIDSFSSPVGFSPVSSTPMYTATTALTAVASVDAVATEDPPFVCGGSGGGSSGLG